MIRNKAAILGVGVALTVGGCGFGSFEEVTSPNNAEVDQAYNEARAYWVEKGVGSAASTGLVTVKDPADKVMCHDDSDLEHGERDVIYGNSWRDVARYCAGDNRIVVVDDAFRRDAEQASDIIDKQDFAKFILGHEIGHHVTVVRVEEPPHLRVDGRYKQDTVTTELRADCYAGEFVAKRYPGSVNKIADYLTKGSWSATYASGEQRAAAFRAGGETTDYSHPCGTYTLKK
jgi:hypothetical protein